MKLVAKFGGSVLRDSEGYKRSAEVVKDLIDNNNEVVVVVSAMKGVTDSLLNVANSIHKGWRPYVKALKARHLRVLEELSASPKWYKVIDALFDELSRVLWALEILKESTPRTRDYILSFGERLSVNLMAAALEKVGLRARPMNPLEAGIYTDDNFSQVSPLYDLIEKVAKERISNVLEEGIIPVVTGFLGTTTAGIFTTLGRGGSDLTATILGASLGVDEVRLYTDVDGIKTANPKEFPNAITIRELSVYEAIEMARLGAKKLHPRTFEPVLRRPVDVRVLSLYDPQGNSTLISYGKKGPKLKSVAMINEMTIITVKGVGMVGMRGTAAKVMEAAAKIGANIYAISQPISETSISIVVKEEKAEAAAKAIKASLEGSGINVEVELRKNISTVSVVGKGLENPSFVGDVLSMLEDMPVLMIAKGPLDLSLSVITPTKYAKEVASRYHEEILREMKEYYGEAK
ncbi:hypothetical protein IPA_04690 [Ignicoccus pacificus DSM 13166]|uniref:Aspartokinase n=1 Tax=Ignicoccus pacificus DSM 13166 TaxID=940294 RepID=A0A977KCR7_9CREN|nr:hypothetical protein IPA_04690 [Ignicoccus pacificus DSM 13166]